MEVNTNKRNSFALIQEALAKAGAQEFASHTVNRSNVIMRIDLWLLNTGKIIYLSVHHNGGYDLLVPTGTNLIQEDIYFITLNSKP